MTAAPIAGDAPTKRRDPFGPAPSGADAAATALYAAHFDRLVALAARLLADTDEAEDVAQEALIAACAALSRGQRLARPAAWLTRATRNLAVSRLRARRGRVRLGARLGAVVGMGAAATPLDADPASVVEDAEAIRRVVAALGALRPHHRDTLLQHLRGAGGAADAAGLGLTEAAWRTRLGRAREALRLMLAAPTSAMPIGTVADRRRAVATRHAQGLPPAAIARALGLPRHTVIADLVALRRRAWASPINEVRAWDAGLPAVAVLRQLLLFGDAPPAQLALPPCPEPPYSSPRR